MTALRPGARIALIGSGVSGLVAAHRLQHDFDLTIFEAGDYIGGHTNTVDVECDGHTYPVDTGFIVFNAWTYPHFIALMDELGVASQESSMSFSVKCSATGVEYCGSSLRQLFAQTRNLVRPSFLWMLREILRFNREAPRLLDGDDDISLGGYLDRHGYSQRFRDHYIIPMGAAIWSACPETMREIPARFFIRFFKNHGMLSVEDRPTWRVIRGGSRSYVQALTAPFRDRFRLSTPVRAVHRAADGVEVETAAGRERFDAVVFATHSDTALQLLAAPTPEEQEILGAIQYQANEAVLHTDIRVLPRRPLAWAAWNYHVPRTPQEQVAVTYNMNILQTLRTPDGQPLPEQFCVTLNDDTGIDEDRVIQRIQYHHPVFDAAAVAAQPRHDEISGVHRTYYCGAYWGNGFHEDGVVSGIRAADQILQAELASAR